MRKTPTVYEKQHDERQETILSVTKKLALEEGFANVTMGAIAKRAHVSRQRLYLYFPNTDALFYRIQIQDMAAFVAFIKSTLTSIKGQSGKESLLALTAAVFAYRKKHSEDFLFTNEFDTYYRARRADEALRKEYEMTYKDNEFREAILAFFKDGIAQGDFRTDLIPEDAAFFWSNTLQLIEERLSIFEHNGETHAQEETALYEREALKALTSYLL